MTRTRHFGSFVKFFNEFKGSYAEPFLFLLIFFVVLQILQTWPTYFHRLNLTALRFSDPIEKLNLEGRNGKFQSDFPGDS